ncbi:MAG: hypothetical protein NTW51_08605 [Cyanobacteria bacterium]|nr:hypothetical protein [Cyanobacteriota bacterium]
MIEQLLTGLTLRTLSQYEQLICLTEEMRTTFSRALSEIESIENSFQDRPTIVYRGMSRQHIERILSRDDQPIEEGKLLSRLFFYGEKAKAFYHYTEEEAQLLPWLKNIEDSSEGHLEK